ncbi:MAG: cysteine desulfurase [Actinomycetota bacterium]|nr:cysteine desulfurase [Actinomycetota bacterium]
MITVDCVGRSCPVPVIELAKAVVTVGVGDIVEILSDDPAARVDIPAWCRMKEQEYVGEEPRDVGAAYLVRRTS